MGLVLEKLIQLAPPVMNGGEESLSPLGRSLSFRFGIIDFDVKVRKSPCECQFHAQCDTWRKTAIDSAQANTLLEDQYVKNVYNDIAAHFRSVSPLNLPSVLIISVPLDINHGQELLNS